MKNQDLNMIYIQIQIESMARVSDPVGLAFASLSDPHSQCTYDCSALTDQPGSPPVRVLYWLAEPPRNGSVLLSGVTWFDSKDRSSSGLLSKLLSTVSGSGHCSGTHDSHGSHT